MKSRRPPTFPRFFVYSQYLEIQTILRDPLTPYPTPLLFPHHLILFSFLLCIVRLEIGDPSDNVQVIVFHFQIENEKKK